MALAFNSNINRSKKRRNIKHRLNKKSTPKRRMSKLQNNKFRKTTKLFKFSELFSPIQYDGVTRMKNKKINKKSFKKLKNQHRRTRVNKSKRSSKRVENLMSKNTNKIEKQLKKHSAPKIN